MPRDSREQSRDQVMASVKLQSSDGNEITVPKEVAQQSVLIKNMLEGEDPNREYCFKIAIFAVNRWIRRKARANSE